MMISRMTSWMAAMGLIAYASVGKAYANYGLSQEGEVLMEAVGVLSDAMQDLKFREGKAAGEKLNIAESKIDSAEKGLKNNPAMKDIWIDVTAAAKALRARGLPDITKVESTVDSLTSGLTKLIAMKKSPTVEAQLYIELALLINDGQMLHQQGNVLINARKAARDAGAISAMRLLGQALWESEDVRAVPESRQRRVEKLLLDAMDELMYPMG